MLSLNLIPIGCADRNVRKFMTAKEWFAIVAEVKKRNEGHCQTCGDERRRMDCHEEWIFEDGVQRLQELMLLCVTCHRVKHLHHDVSSWAWRWLRKVNGITEKEAREAVVAAIMQRTSLEVRFEGKWIYDVKQVDEKLREYRPRKREVSRMPRRVISHSK